MRSKNNPLKALDVSQLHRLSNSVLVSCQKFVHLLSWSIVAELEWGRYCGGDWGLRGLEGNGMWSGDDMLGCDDILDYIWWGGRIKDQI